jgi:GT2 family glycosyltransferase
VVNGQTEATADAIAKFVKFTGSQVFYMPENVGTAKAVNRAMRERQTGEYFVKMDNDVRFYRPGWLDDMEEAMRADPTIGILGLKRSDLEQHPNHDEERFRSTLRFVPSCIEKGKPWICVEETADIMGTCTMFSPALLYAIGYMYQPGYYGYDDVLMCVRSHVAGFKNCFLPHIRIDHLDPVFEEGTPDHYSGWKSASAWSDGAEYNRIKEGYENGSIPIYSPETW